MLRAKTCDLGDEFLAATVQANGIQELGNASLRPDRRYEVMATGFFGEMCIEDETLFPVTDPALQVDRSRSFARVAARDDEAAQLLLDDGSPEPLSLVTLVATMDDADATVH